MVLHFLEVQQHISKVYTPAAESHRRSLHNKQKFLSTQSGPDDNIGAADLSGQHKSNVEAHSSAPLKASSAKESATVSRNVEATQSTATTTATTTTTTTTTEAVATASPAQKIQHRRHVNAHLFCSDDWRWSATSNWSTVLSLGMLGSLSETGRSDLAHVFNKSALPDAARILQQRFPGLLTAMQCRLLLNNFSQASARPGPFGLKMRTKSYATGKLNYGSKDFRK